MAWTYEWTAGYTNFSESEKYENARLLWYGLKSHGWTDSAVAGAMGNFEYESGGQFNLGQWQHGYHVGDWDTAGLGLGQWTPASKLADYCGGRTEQACCNGDKQIAFIATGNQWLTNLVNRDGYSRYYGYSGIPYYDNLSQYTSDNSKSPEDMCLSFQCFWERGDANDVRKSMSTRQGYARKWFNTFGGSSGSGYAIRLHAQGNCQPFATLHLDEGIENQIYSAEAGTDVFIHANVGAGDYFLLWTSDYGGAVIDVETGANTFFTMPASVVDITAHATGTTPTPPPPPIPPIVLTKTNRRMPIWMYPCLRR